MIINQYAGNTDWDHHNWYAIRRNNTNKEGFKFLCWDSELIFVNANENVVTKRNSGGPTDIFNMLLKNEDFARRYVKRAKELLADDGLLGETSVVEVWDSLYNNISSALYDEAARWGDYRRDVPGGYGFSNTLYTVDETYQAERNRLLTQYFPTRTATVLSQITKYITVDDFEAPENWVALVDNMFYEWNGSGEGAQALNSKKPEWKMKSDVSNGGVVVGFSAVDPCWYADLSQYEKLVIRGKGGSVRILSNRDVATREWKELTPSFNENDPYWNADYEALVIPLDDIMTKTTSSNNQRNDTYVHLNAIKANWGNTVNVQSIYLVPKDDSSNIDIAKVEGFKDNRYYNLQGQPVAKPTKGLYILNGKKVLVK
jgi:hypothetical protein